MIHTAKLLRQLSRLVLARFESLISWCGSQFEVRGNDQEFDPSTGSHIVGNLKFQKSIDKRYGIRSKSR